MMSATTGHQSPNRRITIFDYQVTANNPIGGCHRRLMRALASDYDFTVYAVDFEPPVDDGSIRFRKVPVPRRPLALLFVAYHLIAPLMYLFDRMVRFRRPALIQFVESNLVFGDVAYAHFCHRAFLRLKGHGLSFSGLRGWLRWLDHRLHAALEPVAYRRARHIVVPSRGLKAELEREYPFTRGKVQVIYNPIDTRRMARPADFDAGSVRTNLGLAADDVVITFIALGHFERKGLPILLDALARDKRPNVKLVVVGGRKALISGYEKRAEALGLADRVVFTGNVADVRPYLWASDVFALPSHYEAFPLVALEAAAAGVPLLATRINGVEELVQDGEHGILVEPTVDSVADAIARFAETPPEERRTMGGRAAATVERFAEEHFAPRWRSFYAAAALPGDIEPAEARHVE